MMQAVFKGENGSMGLTTRQSYLLDTYIEHNQIWVVVNNLKIPYASIAAFLKSWDVKFW